jgi:hypothetical protein
MAILWRSVFKILIIGGSLEALPTTSDHIAEAGREMQHEATVMEASGRKRYPIRRKE